ncbi:MAG TPA: type II toxin-antitoxin system RelE/ParE family toxin [Gemmataceae bacterium]|nr:type II toxin-antitoxin system RelE/ParE family toxin [Gemmataceae bacterium]
MPEAKDEYDDAVDWYEQRQAGLGAAFITRAREVLQRIAANPQIYATVYQDVREARVRQFPYTVVYREEQGEVVIIAVFHSARDPSVWQSRI